jgi:hypothetical protein
VAQVYCRARALRRLGTARLARLRDSSCSIFSRTTMDRIIRDLMNVSSDLLDFGPIARWPAWPEFLELIRWSQAFCLP